MQTAPYSSVRAPGAMVCSADQLAAQAGMAALSLGGNAVDAAIATNAAIAVTGPHLCGMGGDLFAIVHHGDDRPAVLNASGRAGSGADAARLRDEGWAAMPFRHDVRAVTVPGCVDGWAELHKRFARLPLADLLAPAIALAEDGFPASPLLVGSIAQLDERGREALHELASQATRPGARVRRPGVGRTLRAIAANGRGAFYEGAFGEGLVELGQGWFSPADLERTQADWVEPLGAQAWGHTLWTVPPNSQGYLTLSAAVIAAGLDLPADPADPEWAHLLIEAAVAAGFDRPDVLWEGAGGDALLASGRLDARRASIGPNASRRLAPSGTGDTTYLCTVDAERMGVSLIQSNASGFGSWLVEPRTGINLHNRGMGFAVAAGHPAELRAGARPPHTLAPAMATDSSGDLACVFGTMGGDGQPQILLQLAARLFAHGQSPAEAIAAGRWVLRGPTTGFDTWTGDERVVVLEGHTPADWLSELTARGHRTERIAPFDTGAVGHAHAIVVEPSGMLAGAADPRARVCRHAPAAEPYRDGVTHPLLTRDALGFVRVGVASPEVVVADVAANRGAIEAAVRRAEHEGAQIIVTPELGLTGYTCGDLFAQDVLLDAAWTALIDLAESLADLRAAAVVVGLPVRTADGRVYNTAAVVATGTVHGLVPKQHLPNRAEFYEDRWFTRGTSATGPTEHQGIPFGTDLLFALGGTGATLGIEICEDLWAVSPPSGPLALAGATVIANPSASPEVLGKASYRRDLVRQQSARTLTAYLYAGSGPGESTTDLVFGGHCLVAENGSLLAESTRFGFAPTVCIADIDVERLVHERTTNASFGAAAAPSVRFVPVPLATGGTNATGDGLSDLRRPVDAHPFVPDDPTTRGHHCEEIFAIQATGLAKRLRHTGARTVALGISGGLDSTLALLVTARAFDALGLPRSGIVAVTMPGFGTTDRTYDNAIGLMQALGTTARDIPIVAAVTAHFADIAHDPSQHDVTFENAQARERTQILMDVANQTGGFVVGTGDLSEAALGWMTFNGDHMSMYHVNAGVPKTLVRYLVTWAADEVFEGEVRQILHDVVDTPITPELLPLDSGRLVQKTEDTVGPYELHDFFLFHLVRYGARPSKIYALACHAFAGRHDPASVARWLEVFLRRFFSQQFKRSSMPDGPKVGSVALSPRGDWRMPSDASAVAWLAELKEVIH